MGHYLKMSRGETQLLFSMTGTGGPWSLDARLVLVREACEFFGLAKLGERHSRDEEPPGRRPQAELPTVLDFASSLTARGVFGRQPSFPQVLQILRRMEATGLLVSIGQGKLSIPGLGDRYISPQSWDALVANPFRLVPVLGPEYLYRICEPGLVQITGRDLEGDVVAGTGLAIHPCFILTCAHVLNDMVVDDRQLFQGRTCQVAHAKYHLHPAADVALLRVDVDSVPLTPIAGLVLRTPVVGQDVFALGYPKIPGVSESVVTLQSGSVTNERVQSLAGEELFLYSAIARPGNSGGPIISDEGYLVGLSVVDATARYRGEGAFSPHYAGVPADVVTEAVTELDLGVGLTYETCE